MSTELFDRCIRLWGSELQMNMALEEMGECIVAIQHYRRGRINADVLASEIADVEIMMGQLRRIADLDKRVDACKAYKLERLEGRVSGRLAIQHG